jgi:hypothetical protein
VARLGSLQFALHQAQRLARGEDGLPSLRVMSVFLAAYLGSFIGGATYPAARHGETVGRLTAVWRALGMQTRLAFSVLWLIERGREYCVVFVVVVVVV